LECEEVGCHGSLKGRDSGWVEARESVFEVATKSVSKPAIHFPPAVGIEPTKLVEKTGPEPGDT